MKSAKYKTVSSKKRFFKHNSIIFLIQNFQIRDTETEIIEKLRTLYNHFVQAKQTGKPIFVLIGAGVSTGSKLPDFRGKQGVWTLQAEGKHAEGVDFQVVRCLIKKKHFLNINKNFDRLVPESHTNQYWHFTRRVTSKR